MILRIAAIFAIAILALLLFAASKPNTLTVQRSIAISAPPQKVFALINDLHSWKDWNREPQEDPNITRIYGGPPSGEGASCKWEGKGSAGQGTMLISESQPPERITVQVDFVKPFESHNLNVFSVVSSGNETILTWSWKGQNLYFMKLMGVFANMDKMIGTHFETGLQNVKTLAEK